SPLVLVGVDVLGHGGFKLFGNTQGGVHHYFLDVLDAAVEPFLPTRGALQPGGGADVVHEVAVDVLQQCFVIQVLGEQLGVCRGGTAVAAYVQVPAISGGDDADVLAAGFCTLTGATGNTHLQLVRAAQAPVPQFQGDGHGYGILDAEAAPCGPNAGLHRAQALAVGLAGFEAGVNQFLPDVRQLLQAGTEHIDALATSDLGVQVVLFGDRCDDPETLGRDFTTGNARNHRVGAILLHVRQRAVVGVLQGTTAGIQDVGGVLAGQDGGDGRLADIATGTRAVLGHDLLEGGQFQDADSVKQLLAGQADVLAQGLGNLDAGLLQFAFEELLQHRDAGTTLGAGTRATLEFAELLHGSVALAGTATVDGVADGSGRDIVAGAQDCIVRKLGPRRLPATVSAQESAGFGRQFTSQQRAQAHVRGSVAHEDAAQEGLCIVSGDDLLVNAAGGVGIDDFEGVFGAGKGITEARHIHAGQLQLGGGIEPRERCLAAMQAVRHDLGHGVCGGNEAQAHALEVSHFTDGPNTV